MKIFLLRSEDLEKLILVAANTPERALSIAGGDYKIAGSPVEIPATERIVGVLDGGILRNFWTDKVSLIIDLKEP